MVRKFEFLIFFPTSCSLIATIAILQMKLFLTLTVIQNVK